MLFYSREDSIKISASLLNNDQSAGCEVVENIQSESMPKVFSRRHFLQTFSKVGTMMLMAPVLASHAGILNKLPYGRNKKSFLDKRDVVVVSPKKEDHIISIINTHTGESLQKCLFWGNGEYDPIALKKINSLFRDHRTQEVCPIDKQLLHLLHKMSKQLDTTEPFHLISGYRSSQTNKLLRVGGRGVATNSQHLYGKAADIMVPGRTLKHVQKAAKSFHLGGVGRYSSFVHVDTGRIRYWGMI